MAAEMGWRPTDFWDATLGEFIHSWKGHQKAQERKWERTRLIVATQINTHVTKKQDQVNVEDVVRLSIDNERQKTRAEWIKENAPTQAEKDWMKRKGLMK